MTDMMPTDLGNVHVEDWDRMVEKHPTRAAVLQALANLQIRSSLSNGPLPTQKVILQEIITTGLKLDTGEQIHIQISPTSVKEINRHINAHLIPRGYIITRDDYDQNTERGRGGPSAPWQVVAVSQHLRKRIKENK